MRDPVQSATNHNCVGESGHLNLVDVGNWFLQKLSVRASELAYYWIIFGGC
jgi:hypothetical protein